jgi:hypothetical protein
MVRFWMCEGLLESQWTGEEDRGNWKLQQLQLLTFQRFLHPFQHFSSIPTFWIYSNISDLFQYLGPIPMLWTHSNALDSFQCSGLIPMVWTHSDILEPTPLPLIQHFWCASFLRLISKLLDFFPIVLSPFGLVAKFLFIPVPFQLFSFFVPTTSQCLLFLFVILPGLLSP